MSFKSNARRTKAGAYSAYAEELRTIAGEMKSCDAQDKLFQVADDFDRLAKAAEGIARSRKLVDDAEPS